MKERIQKVLAAAGVASRRNVEEMVQQGRIAVNGRIVTRLPVLIDPQHDRITVDDEQVRFDRRHEHERVYLVMNKPKGVYSTNVAQGEQVRAIDLLPPKFPYRVFPVGRLDAESKGLLLLTNDGELTNRLTHPRYGVAKTYRAVVDGFIKPQTIEELQRGVWLADRPVPARKGDGGFKTGRSRIKVVKRMRDQSILEITIREGRNRQVRRMLAKMGHKVRDLTRTRMGPLTLHGLAPGRFRPLSARAAGASRAAAASAPELMTSTTGQNWARNYQYQAARLERPRTVHEIIELVRSSEKVKALGTRHSFNDIADTTGVLISLEHFTKLEEPDHSRSTVTIEAGVTYGQLCPHLHRHGYALHNLASLPHISVAGACATATHGSGDRNGNLATAVRAIQIVLGEGRVEELSRERHGERFAGMVVALGGLGIVTKLTLAVEPAFDMRQDVYEGLPLSQLENSFDAITAGGESVSLFTDWRSERFNQVWLKRRIRDGAPFDPKYAWFEATAADGNRHPIAGISPQNCTEQMGISGPWHERLPHFRMDYMPSSGEELQSEYFVARSHAVAALRVLGALRAEIASLVQISEIRTIAADDLWMSPCFERDSVSIHFTWRNDATAVQRLLPGIEEALAPFGARPHWGKLFAMQPATLQSRYPRLKEFRELLDRYDPRAKFRNRFLEKYVFALRA